jgi:hypothetical protein
MMIDVKQIELFKNLFQYEFNNKYFDFHNDFDCLRVSVEEETLKILFKGVKFEDHVALVFREFELKKMNFFNSPQVKVLTPDNLYRGKFVANEKLNEFSITNQGYFYLEFYEGQKLEFMSTGISLLEM